MPRSQLLVLLHPDDGRVCEGTFQIAGAVADDDQALLAPACPSRLDDPRQNRLSRHLVQDLRTARAHPGALAGSQYDSDWIP